MGRPECFWCDAHLGPDGLCPNGCARSELPELWQSQGPKGDVADEVWDALKAAMKECKRD